ncbi:ABC transporter ATPase [Mannheimia pernigra]|uniref:ABC transporter ATPase n=1 Tax=Mannheimia pernigra TaxID=111844 RepID=UPI00131633BA|nr:ABC transporter ATPase [Mannheimia pernigra]QHB17704.1 ABC transporter ATPase [Mannheimia pernigra]
MIERLFRRGILFASTLMIVACVSQREPFSVPEKVDFQGQTYVKVTVNQLDEMQHLLYLPEAGEKNTEQWEKGILFFLDKNSKNQTLEQRAAFRQSSFAKQKDVVSTFKIEQNELQSSVIYPPTERFHNVMLEVTRGRNLDCGYGQMQFSDKRSLNKSEIAKKSKNLTAYNGAIAELTLEFNQLAWLVGCRK